MKRFDGGTVVVFLTLLCMFGFLLLFMLLLGMVGFGLGSLIEQLFN